MVRKPANYWSRARHGTEIVRGVSRPSPRPPHLPTYRARREPHEHPLLLSEAGVKVTSRASLSLSLCTSCVLALLYSVFGTEYELISDTGDKIFCVARLLMNSIAIKCHTLHEYVLLSSYFSYENIRKKDLGMLFSSKDLR